MRRTTKRVLRNLWKSETMMLRSEDSSGHVSNYTKRIDGVARWSFVSDQFVTYPKLAVELHLISNRYNGDVCTRVSAVSIETLPAC